jgi:prolipoprotein diacylglyceryltransferase
MSDNEAAAATSAASSLFDLRTVIAILFAGYGIVLTIMGFFTSADDLAKAGGINLNLWVGIIMIVIAVLFVVWARTRPLVMEVPPEDDDRPPMHH